MARDIDMTLFDKACEITASALRGAMGGENSQAPSYAGEVFDSIWRALKEASKELPDRAKTGF